MIPQKPYAISCDRNSEPILRALKPLLADCKHLLEMGSGTGQHAIYMAPHFPALTWTLSDRAQNHEGIQQWLKDFPRVNLRGPLEYEVGQNPWPEGSFDCLFTANSLHIMSWELCLGFFNYLNFQANGFRLIIYGAFNYNGQFTSESNKKFNQWLKDRDPLSGIRDFEKVSEELENRDFFLFKDLELPANNRLLVFDKK